MLERTSTRTRFERMPLSRVYAMWGLLLATGAPSGMLLLRAIQTPLRLDFAWLQHEISGDRAGYAYLLISTSLVFSLFGFLVGKRAERTRALSVTDPLTGLFNRRGLQQQLHQEAARCARYGGTLALAIVDVDRLKTINDRSGHEAGDRALLLVAQAIRCALRTTDRAFRYGGDEFAILCPLTNAQEASVMIERVRTQLHALVETTPVTISAGIADLSLTHDADRLLAAADRALYQAKAAGRDRIRLASSAPPTVRPATTDTTGAL